MIGWLVTARPEPCARCSKSKPLLAATQRCSGCEQAAQREHRERMRRADLKDAKCGPGR